MTCLVLHCLFEVEIMHVEPLPKSRSNYYISFLVFFFFYIHEKDMTENYIDTIDLFLLFQNYSLSNEAEFI